MMLVWCVVVQSVDCADSHHVTAGTFCLSNPTAHCGQELLTQSALSFSQLHFDMIFYSRDSV